VVWFYPVYRRDRAFRRIDRSSPHGVSVFEACTAIGQPGAFRAQRIDEEFRRPVGERVLNIGPADGPRSGNPAADPGVRVCQRLRPLHFVYRLERGIDETEVGTRAGDLQPDQRHLCVAGETDVLGLRPPAMIQHAR